VLASRVMARARILVLLVTGAIGGVGACSTDTSAPPLGNGDHLIVDVDASELPPQPDVYVPPDSPFAEVADACILNDLAYDASPANAVLTVCEPPDGSASGGEGGVEPSADGAAASGKGGAAASCEPFPAACASQPDCECLFPIFGPKLPCAYPNCSVGMGFNFHCPPGCPN
jgi:hypothetical protein